MLSGPFKPRPKEPRFRIRYIEGFGYSPETRDHSEWWIIKPDLTTGVHSKDVTGQFSRGDLAKTEREAGERINAFCKARNAPIVWQEGKPE